MKERYKYIYQKQAQFYEKHPVAKKWLKFFNLFLPILVAIVYFYLIAILFLFNRQRQATDFWRLLFFPALCFCISTLLRRAIHRKRPYEEGIIPLIKKTTVGKSFPSRHLCCAFVIGMVALSYNIPLGIAVLFIGILIGYIRFTAGIHYFSDLFFGAILGILCALPAFFIG